MSEWWEEGRGGTPQHVQTTTFYSSNQQRGYGRGSNNEQEGEGYNDQETADGGWGRGRGGGRGSQGGNPRPGWDNKAPADNNSNWRSAERSAAGFGGRGGGGGNEIEVASSDIGRIIGLYNDDCTRSF